VAAVWAWGDFRGGRLLTLPQFAEPFLTDVKEKWAFLNPCTAHAVEAWEGHRISLIAYWRDAGPLPEYDRGFLRSLGFELDRRQASKFPGVPGACGCRDSALQHVALCRRFPVQSSAGHRLEPLARSPSGPFCGREDRLPVPASFTPSTCRARTWAWWPRM
jgi:hypothetical protein